MKTTIELAEQIRGPKGCDWWMTDSLLERFADLVRADEREECLNCYSPDDTATDWADKIRARGNT